MKKLLIFFVIILASAFFVNHAEACGKGGDDIGGGWCYYPVPCHNVHDGKGGSWSDQQICERFGERCPAVPGPGPGPSDDGETPKTDGQCGGFSDGFNPRTGLFNPSGSCAVGGVSASWNGWSYSWSCISPDGGNSPYCGGWNVYPKDGVCGGVNGKITTKKPDTLSDPWYYMCSSGPQSVLSILGNTYKWLCRGTYGGDNASCQAEMLPQVGKCGDYFVPGSTALVESLPTENSILCKRGWVTNTASSTTAFTWNCAGAGGAASSGVCSAKKVGDGQSATIFSTSTPVTTLTVTGRITPNIVNKGQYCSLSDLEYTTNKGADDSFVVCGVYRNNVPYADKSLETTNYQVEPGYEYEFRCQDNGPMPPGSKASGKTQPLKCVLNPTILER